MLTLINEFKKEHLSLKKQLSAIREASVVRPEGREMLMSLRDELMNHLKKEDELLYLILDEESKKNELLKNTLDKTSTHTKNITKLFSSFFQKYSACNDDIPLLSLANDYAILVKNLNIRMNIEEEILFDECLLKINVETPQKSVSFGKQKISNC